MQIAVHDTTGKRLHSVGGVSYFNAWRCLKEQIAADQRIHEADADEAIRIEEDDDGIEWCTVEGRRLGYVVSVIDGHTFGAPETLAADAADPLPANDNRESLTRDLALVARVMAEEVAL